MIGHRGRDLIRSFERLCLEAYDHDDEPGLCTIGYSHTRGVKLGDTCTREQAEVWLSQDINDAELVMLKYVKRDLSEGQRDALVSAVFNLGPKVLRGDRKSVV